MIEKYGTQMDEEEFLNFKKVYDAQVKVANLYIQSQKVCLQMLGLIVMSNLMRYILSIRHLQWLAPIAYSVMAVGSLLFIIILWKRDI